MLNHTEAPTYANLDQVMRNVRVPVGRGYRFDGHRSESERPVTIEQARFGNTFTGRSVCPGRQPDRDRVALRQTSDPGEVIRVFVGHKDCGQIFRYLVEARESFSGFLDRKTAVDQYQCVTGFDDGGITATAAAEICKPHGLVTGLGTARRIHRHRELCDVALYFCDFADALFFDFVDTQD